MININIYDGAPKGALTNKGLNIKICEWSNEGILFDGDTPLTTVTIDGLQALYDMLSYDKSDTLVQRAIDIITDFLG